jgi:hypothetical protein
MFLDFCELWAESSPQAANHAWNSSGPPFVCAEPAPLASFTWPVTVAKICAAQLRLPGCEEASWRKAFA